MNAQSIVVTFKPKQVTKSLLAPLSKRNQEVLVGRFGLGRDPGKLTLETIGGQYSVTRERVRQIENFSLNAIKKSDAYQAQSDVFDELRDFVESLGAIVSEETLFHELAGSQEQGTQNHLYFLMTLADVFDRKREDQHFRHRWSVNEEVSRLVHQALHKLYQNISSDDLITETEILEMLREHVSGVPGEYIKNDDVLSRWLAVSKVIGRNPIGEWGLTVSPNIGARGIRDYAYLVLRRHGSPLHFTEVARHIREIFNRKAHVATCHNELIKDKERFVLVGRGLYGLSEWGYSNGIVRDVVRRILEKSGPLTKEEMIKRVLKERHVKENTVSVNLQNRNYFKRLDDGRYTAV